MPKISSNQQYYKNGENFIILKPSFPSTLMIDDLIKKNNTNNNPKPLPNAFIAYRMALMKEYRIKNCKLPPMSKVSKIAKNSWNMEPKHVKDFYESLVKDVKSIYKQNNIQIVLDKHMSGMVNNQESYDTVVNENHQTQNSGNAENSIHDNKFSSPSVSSTDSLTTSINDREYIKVLEQTIDYLLKKSIDREIEK
ncbi:unnamed protein product [Rhizophagus irregularis]|uniref:MATA-HMG n=1 Tax=Rhizophagus irregularis TaxID=588596 RepID=A0A1B1EUV0_9GLOM|nr:MATA-HMG [Rhizophagus irregularis]PKY48444.1 hypothetical protein RhiirA4_464042 [Rhizophagus irregularis]CAB4404301.1 unnamed protein product [Rhizophagus irregularis]CAB4404704.1 unnamed protein product [Rhizophagus irregularis]